MLYLSAFAMGVAGFNATLKHERLIGASFLASSGFSILHHANYTQTNYHGGPWIAFIDRCLARWCFVFALVKTYSLPFTWRTFVMYLSLLSGTVVYARFIYSHDKPYRRFVISKRAMLHAIFLHVMPSISVMLYNSK